MRFHRSHALTCREVAELVTDYLEAALTRQERRRLEAHLARCPDCPNYVEQMRQTVDLIGQLAADPLAPEADRQLRAAFAEWRRRGG